MFQIILSIDIQWNVQKRTKKVQQNIVLMSISHLRIKLFTLGELTNGQFVLILCKMKGGYFLVSGHLKEI